MSANGLISTGRGQIYIIVSIALAALLLGRRAALIVWGASTVVLGIITFSLITRTPEDPAILAQQMYEPYTLLINAGSTLVIGGILALCIISLINSLGQSLRITEQALAERDEAYALLEQRVAVRPQARSSQPAWRPTHRRAGCAHRPVSSSPNSAACERSRMTSVGAASSLCRADSETLLRRYMEAEHNRYRYRPATPHTYTDLIRII